MKRRYANALQICTAVAALRINIIAAGKHPSCCSGCGSSDASRNCAFVEGVSRRTRERRVGARASVGGEHLHDQVYIRGFGRIRMRSYPFVSLFGGSTSLAEHEGINLGELTEADRQHLLRRLLVDAHLLSDGDPALDDKGDDAHLLFDGGYASETLGRGFCNWVYKVTPTSSSLVVGNDDIDSEGRNAVVVKVFSDLAKVRVSNDVLGSFDVLASDCNIGPNVIHRGSNGIVMEYIDGMVLTEEDVHGIAKDDDDSNDVDYGDGRILCEKIGAKLAQLHYTPIPSNIPVVTKVDNMLWKTLEAMLDFVGDDGPIPAAVLEAGWTHGRLRQEVQIMRQELDALHLPVVLCHGDFKPSNIVAVNDSERNCVGEIVLIDYELSGPGYRGFDFYKLFRTSKCSRQNDANMKAFVRSYLRCSESVDNDASSKIDSTLVEQVLSEMKLFEPLTWLEAGVFFLFAAKGDPTQIHKWEKLALGRFNNFDACKSRFQANLDEYTSTKAKR